MTSSLPPIFRHHYSGTIWQVKADPQAQKLALEIRNSNKTVELIVVDPKTQRSVKAIFPDAIGWWSYLVRLHDGSLFLMRWEDQSNPGPGTLIELDYESGKILNEIRAFQIENQTNETLTGTIKNELGISQPVEINFTSNLQSTALPIGIPAVYVEGTEKFEIVAEYLRSEEIEPVHLVDYFEKGDQIIIGYYKQEKNELNRYILWLKGEKKVLHQVIDQKMNGIGSESFLTTENYLIFVTDRSTLNIYAL